MEKNASPFIRIEIASHIYTTFIRVIKNRRAFAYTYI
jgi:hypothetical protein